MIGYFFELVKKLNYWNDIIFLIIVDYDLCVVGDDLVLICYFYIFVLLLGSYIELRCDNCLVS